MQLGRDTAATGTALPTPDATGTYNLSSNGGRIAITVGTTPLTGTGPWTRMSGVAYQSSTFTLEGASAANPGNPGSMLQRGTNGCAQTGVNNTDMTLANIAAPKNTSSAALACTCP